MAEYIDIDPLITLIEMETRLLLNSLLQRFPHQTRAVEGNEYEHVFIHRDELGGFNKLVCTALDADEDSDYTSQDYLLDVGDLIFKHLLL